MKAFNTNRITDISSLQKERDRLQMHIEISEKEISQRYDYFRSNFKSLIWNQINPLGNNESLKSTVGTLLQSVIIPAITHGGKETLGEAVAGALLRLVRLIRNRRRRKNTEDSN